MAGIDKILGEDLRDLEFAEGYWESFLDTYIATQIKVLREQRDLTQKQLADRLGTTQTVISRIEGPYSAWSVRTLKHLARAFGLTLRVSFESYETFIGDVSTFGRATLQRIPHAADPALFPERQPRTATRVKAAACLIHGKPTVANTIQGPTTQGRLPLIGLVKPTETTARHLESVRRDTIERLVMNG